MLYSRFFDHRHTVVSALVGGAVGFGTFYRAPRLALLILLVAVALALIRTAAAAP